MATNLKGTISPIGRLSGTVSKDVESVPIYDGDYEVTPDAYNDQILYTANKILRTNLTVHKVPFYQTHNDQDGTTIFIAMEV